MGMERQKRLVQLLVEKTQAGRLEWRKGVERNTYSVSLTSYGILLKDVVRTLNRETVTDVKVSMVNGEGVVVDSFTDVDLDSSKSSDDWAQSWFQTMTSLLKLAARAANGADKALDDIIDELED